MARIKKDPIDRFKEKYIVDPNTGCWNWQDTLLHNGYGRLQQNGKSIKAHRFAYEYYNGSIKEGYFICHSCNNRRCVNPKHLRQDTHSSNMIDMVLSNNGKDQILSVDEVIEIKKALKHYYRGQIRDLAHFYKVSERQIYHIKNDSRWSHIQIP
jgi:hypothetical protein